jgi:glycosyltransferase involved in cell wall biosynthesis
MRVLAVANWNAGQSPTSWANQRLASLRAAGAEVELLAHDCVGDRLGWLRLWRALATRLGAARYDVVVPLYGSLLGLLCAAQRRAPCAMSFVGSDLNGEPALLSRLSVSFSQLTTLLAADVSLCSEAMRPSLWSAAARRRARVIPDGVDTARFYPRPRDEARRRRGLSPDGARVLFVASRADARPVKRVALARAAVARLPGVTLEEIQSLPFEEMPWAYASADALVLTSLREGSPNCVKEALACALPVVAVDVGDVRELLAGLTNCAVVAAAPDALADALAAALVSGRGCPDGPARIAARYSLDRTAAAFLRFYADAAAHSRSRSTS